MDISKKIQDLIKNIEKVIKGKPDVVRLSIIALFARGHILIEDIPGVGKTTLAHCLATSLNCSFKRIQFTSDMLPADILGVSIYNPSSRNFEFKPGPIFSNIVLADEINRASPRTQSSLLEAMNESQVSIDRKTYILPQPFMVMATQNPLEYYGTFPLPESQLDRFLMRIRIGYPAPEDEKNIISLVSFDSGPKELSPVLNGEEVLEIQKAVEQVKVEESLIDYIWQIVDATRRSPLLGLGASPRGGIFLKRASQSLAFILGRDFVIPDDIKQMAIPVLAHRVIPNTRGEGFGKRRGDTDQIIKDIIDTISVPI